MDGPAPISVSPALWVRTQNILKKVSIGRHTQKKLSTQFPTKKFFKKLLFQLPKGKSLREDVPCRLSARVDNHILGKDQPVEALQGEGGLHVKHHVLAYAIKTIVKH